MLRVLCLDGEGGWGGSSRSLAKSLQYMDRDALSVEVWCRRAGPIQEIYEQLNIRCRVMSEMPATGAVARLSRNLASEALANWRWQHTTKLQAEFLSRLRDIDLIHFNLESQWWLARWLRTRHSHAQTMHVRTNTVNNLFGRRQIRIAANVVDQFVFITDNERKHFEQLARRVVPGEVIFNIADREKADIAPHPAIPLDHRLRIGVLSNFTWPRGLDRLIDIAEALVQRGKRKEFLFIVAGDMTLTGYLEGPLREIGRRGGTLVDYARSRGLDDMFLFLGHVSPPEAVLAGCDVVASPKRNDNPWGRDILEALAFGRPVISTGRYSCFVESGVTGFLQAHYDAGEIADILLHLDADRKDLKLMGNAGRKRIAALCDGPSRARDLLKVWSNAVLARTAAVAL